MSTNPQRPIFIRRPAERIGLDWPVVVFDPSPSNGDALVPEPLRPDYFDTLKRVFVLLRSGSALGREIHNLVQAHFATGLPTLVSISNRGRITQADLRTILEMEAAIDRLSYRIGSILNRAGKHEATPDGGPLHVQQGWAFDEPLPEAPRPPAAYNNRYVDLGPVGRQSASVSRRRQRP